MRIPALVLAVLLLAESSGSVVGQRSEIRVASYSSYAGSDGLFHVVGEVQNNLGTAVGGVKVYATFYDHDGNIVATKVTGAFIDDLRPGEKSPFSIALADPGDIAKMASYELAAASSRPPETREPYVKVQVGQGHVDEKGAYRLAGINASSIESASANAYCSEYSSIAGAWKSRHLLTLVTDSPSYGSGQEIRVSGNVTAPDGYVIIEIRRSDRVLHDKATARITPEGHYERAVRFYALPEYLGQDFIVKARYGDSVAETTFQFK